MGPDPVNTPSGAMQQTAIAQTLFGLKIQRDVEARTILLNNEQRNIALRTSFEQNLGRRFDLLF